MAGGRRTTVNELANRVREAVGRGRPTEHRPPRAGDIPHSLADLALSRAALGFDPATDLAAGLRLTAPHYRAALKASTRAVAARKGGLG